MRRKRNAKVRLSIPLTSPLVLRRRPRSSRFETLQTGVQMQNLRLFINALY
jgi:hypothetical protein